MRSAGKYRTRLQGQSAAAQGGLPPPRPSVASARGKGRGPPLEAEFAQDRVSVGVEVGGSGAGRRIGETRQLHWVAGELKGTGDRIIDGDNHVARSRLRVGNCLRDVVD